MIIKKYFYKFRMAGIRHFMQIELKKKLVVKNLIIKMNKENNINNKENKNEIEIENKKYKTLNKLILKYIIIILIVAKIFLIDGI